MNEAPHALAFELLGALSSVQGRLEAALEPLGLSLAKYGALSRLAAAAEPLPLSTLAERCACVRSNITQLVDRLEAEKLVTRVHDPRDRRSILADLTDEGRSRQVAGKRAIEKAEKEIFGSIAPEGRDALRKLFAALQEGC
jgi:DNA-binding MarR family transcriptional regulator